MSAACAVRSQIPVEDDPEMHVTPLSATSKRALPVLWLILLAAAGSAPLLAQGTSTNRAFERPSEAATSQNARLWPVDSHHAPR